MLSAETIISSFSSIPLLCKYSPMSQAMLSTTDWPRPTCWVQRDGADIEAGPEGETGVEGDPGHAGRAHAET